MDLLTNVTQFFYSYGNPNLAVFIKNVSGQVSPNKHFFAKLPSFGFQNFTSLQFTFYETSNIIYNIIGCTTLLAVSCPVTCCNMLSVVGLSLKMVKFGPTTLNTVQHRTTGWPNACNILCPTMLRYVVIVWLGLKFSAITWSTEVFCVQVRYTKVLILGDISKRSIDSLTDSN